MAHSPRTIPIDTGLFAKETGPFPTRYGLPPEVRFCRRCVISNQRPNSSVEYAHGKDSAAQTIHFDSDGVCDACRVAESKRTAIDWSLRRKELADLCDRYRKDDGSYDCLIPGSGGKDSIYATNVLKHEFGMHPLTVTWAPHIYTDWGWKNFQGWINSGFDNQLHTPNGRVHRLLTRLAVENIFHPFQPFILGQKSVAPKVAAQFGIPLIFYGENEAEYGNPKASMGSAQRDYKFFTSQDPAKLLLSGVSLAELQQDYGLEKADLQPYLPADPELLARGGTQVHYLGYYMQWHPQSCYYHAVEHSGFMASPERTPGTFSKYNSIDDKVDDLHFYTTFVKFGIGRATYDASQEVRSGDLTREEGVALVKRYDGEWPERFADELFRYLSIDSKQLPAAASRFEQPAMDKDYFLHLADRFRSPHLWRKDGNAWTLRRAVWHDSALPGAMEAGAAAWTGNRART